MSHKTWLNFVLITLLGLSSQSLLASDTAKEKRWVDQIVDSIMVGDAEWLTVGDQKILGIFTEASTEKPLGGAIVLHGIGVHPNWDQIIRPMRSQLPDYGWSTLSIQMPVLSNEAEAKDYAPLFKEVSPRLDAAVKFLKAKGINNIVIIAHSMGSTMSAHYLSSKPDSGVRAFVAIGMSGVMPDDSMNNTLSLKKIKIPVLDIYGSNDLKLVLEAEQAKKQSAMDAGNKDYTQVKVAGANHFFDNMQDEVVTRVRDWLQMHATAK